MNYYVETTNLTKRYKNTTTVNSLHLQIPEHAVYGFIGPNGAGKSTTLKMLLGLTSPSQGSVKLMGKQMNHKNRMTLLKHVGALIESPSFYAHLTGYENLKIWQSLKGCPTSDIDQVLDIVRLTDAKDKKAGHYSLGMKQRLGIATALLGFPKLLILDEPTNGLDPAGIQEIRTLIRSLPSTYGITVIVSSHMLNEIDLMAEYVGIIDQGRLLYQGTLSELHQLDPTKNLEEIFLTLTHSEGIL